MGQNRCDVEPGSLVMIDAGNYLTAIRPGEQSPAQVLLKSPTVGLVLEEISGRKLILVQDGKNDCIFASTSTLVKI